MKKFKIDRNFGHVYKLDEIDNQYYYVCNLYNLDLDIFDRDEKIIETIVAYMDNRKEK